jgi:hypothetical protein
VAGAEPRATLAVQAPTQASAAPGNLCPVAERLL